MKNKLLLMILLLLPVSLEAQRRSRSLDSTSFIVMGGGLSAGFGNFRLTEELQKSSFPDQMARQMGTIMPQALVREDSNPGILITPGTLISFHPLPNVLPRVRQSGVRTLPFPFFTFNVSVPFIKVSEALNRRPEPVPGADKPALVEEGNLKQSFVNMILGYPFFILDQPVRLTQIEYVEQVTPTLVLVELGFGDVLDAALTGDVRQITPQSSFANDYMEIIRRVRQTHATVVLVTVPDPTDTAYFSTLQNLALRYQVPAETLRSQFNLPPSDLITLGGMIEIADQLKGRRSGPLSDRATLTAPVAAAVQEAVRGFNSAISSAASANGLALFDLNALFKQIKSSGVKTTSLHIQGGFGQGFYSEDGLFPGPTGHAIIANELLAFLNRTFSTNFPLIDLGTVARRDDLVPKDAGGEGSEDLRGPVGIINPKMTDGVR